MFREIFWGIKAAKKHREDNHQMAAPLFDKTSTSSELIKTAIKLNKKVGSKYSDDEIKEMSERQLRKFIQSLRAQKGFLHMK
jgi:peroxiredoxin family protein